MTRDEVLAAVNWAAELFYEIAVDYTGDPTGSKWMTRATALRAAAEIIRESGWRPIAECGDAYLKHVGKWSGNTWKEDWNVWPEWAKANGYTHFFTEPAPPAREDSKS